MTDAVHSTVTFWRSCPGTLFRGQTAVTTKSLLPYLPYSPPEGLNRSRRIARLSVLKENKTVALYGDGKLVNVNTVPSDSRSASWATGVWIVLP